MKYHLMIRARPNLKESIPEKHKAFMNVLAKIKSGWGLTVKERPPIMKPNEFFARISLRGRLGKGITGAVQYRNRESLNCRLKQFGAAYIDTGQYDDFFTLTFNPQKVDYEALVHDAFAKYVEGFLPYIGEVLDEELGLLDFGKREMRAGVYRISPICYFDRELCRRAFHLTPETMARKVAAKVETARIVSDGILIVASSGVLGLEETDRVNQAAKPLLTGTPAAPTRGLKRLIAKMKTEEATKAKERKLKKKAAPGRVSMMALAMAAIEALWFLEETDDELLDPHVAVKEQEYIAYHLQKSSPEEKEALRQALSKLTKEASPKQIRLLEFYRDFMADLGFPDEDE
jgi:hypothetical protein